MFNIHFSIERWKWNADFGIYVSNKGRFRSRDKRDLPIKIGNGGYCMVYCGGNTHKYLSAHRVVMLTWRPTANAENLTVDHLDHNKRNNALDNLEWVTREENERRAKADLLNITVEGNPALVEKVTVAVTPKDTMNTDYPYYIQFEGGVVMSIEQMANMFFETHSKVFGEKNHAQTVEEFTKMLYDRTKATKKVLGFKFTRIPRQ